MSTDALAQTYKITAGTGLSDFWWKTGRMTMKATGPQTGGSFAQFEVNDPEGTATPMHRHHNEDESFYVVEGEVTLLVDGERIDLGAGDYAYAPRGTTHAYIVRSPQARMLTTLSPAGLEELFISLGTPVADTEQLTEGVLPPISELVRHFGAYGCEVVGPPPTLTDI